MLRDEELGDPREKSRADVGHVDASSNSKPFSSHVHGVSMDTRPFSSTALAALGLSPLLRRFSFLKPRPVRSLRIRPLDNVCSDASHVVRVS